MAVFTIHLEPIDDTFYTLIAHEAKLPIEKVLEDALFQYAGQLSMQVQQEETTRADVEN